MAKRGPKGRRLVKGKVLDVLHEEHEKNPDKASEWLAERIRLRTGKHVSPGLSGMCSRQKKGGDGTSKEPGRS